MSSGSTTVITGTSEVENETVPSSEEGSAITDGEPAENSLQSRAERLRRLRPIWNKIVRGIKQRKAAQPHVVWEAMIKKLNRIQAMQKSNQDAQISDLFNQQVANTEERKDESQEQTSEGKFAKSSIFFRFWVHHPTIFSPIFLTHKLCDGYIFQCPIFYDFFSI